LTTTLITELLGTPLDVDYAITIDETNLVQRISMALNAYRRQKDRMADIMDSMKRIASGE
jgi:hypothetical protein